MRPHVGWMCDLHRGHEKQQRKCDLSMQRVLWEVGLSRLRGYNRRSNATVPGAVQHSVGGLRGRQAQGAHYAASCTHSRPIGLYGIGKSPARALAPLLVVTHMDPVSANSEILRSASP